MPIPSLVFPFAADFGETFIERYGYRAGVTRSARGMEQRRLVRARRIGGVEFTAWMQAIREAQLCEAILFGGVTEPLGVPMWPFSSPNTAPLVAAETQVTLGTGVPAEGPYVNGSWIIVWRSPFEYFAATVTGTSATSVQFTPAFSGATWPAYSAQVMPLVSGRLSQSEALEWLDVDVAQCRVAFDLEEEGAAKTWTGSGSTYLSVPVLDAMEPNRSGPLEDEFQRDFRILDNITGARLSVVNTPAPANVRPFRWTCLSRAEIGTLRAFLDARQGRRKPFWFPNWQADLSLAAGASSGSNFIDVVDVEYGSLTWGTTGARRFLMLRDAAGPSYHRVTDTGTAGANERLTITPVLPRAFATGTLVSYLRYARLENDEAEIVWQSGHTAECVLACRDLPLEAPG